MKKKAVAHFTNDAPEMSDSKAFSAAMIILSMLARVYWRFVITHDVIWTYKLPTAATDGVYIYINPTFFTELPNHQQRAFLLAHEVGHIVLRHPLRGRAMRRRGYFRVIGGESGQQTIPFCPKRFNRAADYVINADLVAHGLESIESCLLDDRFTRDHLADDVYAELFTEEQQQEPEPEPEGGEGEGEGEGDAEGEGEGTGAGEGSGDEGERCSDCGAPISASALPPHAKGSAAPTEADSCQTCGSDLTGDNSGGNIGTGGQPAPDHGGHDVHLEPKYEGTPEEIAEAQQEDEDQVDRTLDQGVNEQNEAIEQGEHKDVGYGGGMDEAIKAGEHRHTAEIRWRDELADLFHRSGSGGTANYARIHRRRYTTCGVISPTTKGTVSQFALIGDISYSVNREVFKSTLQEMAVAIDEIQPTNGTCILFTNHKCLDKNVHDVYSGGELLDLEIPSGGGTKLGTALDWMENNGVQPDLTLAFTDGELSYSDLKKLVDNDVVIVLDSIPSYGQRRDYKELQARYIVAVDESQAT